MCQCSIKLYLSLQLSNIAGAQKLVECLKRTDKINSFKLLKLALEECNCDIVLDLLYPEDTGIVFIPVLI